MIVLSNLAGKRLLLGVTGGISVYKSVELLRLLTKAGATVDVAMTPTAARFVGPATFRALSGRPVVLDLFDASQEMDMVTGTMPHLEVAEEVDLAIVAPATANTIVKISLGLADNALTTALLSVTAPILIAPAMDADMWCHPAIQGHIDALKKRGVHLVGPVEGELARRNVGPGRLAEPEEIASAAEDLLAENGKLSGRKVLVTAAGTREPLDPVRFIGNRSSGKMGYAIAEAARRAGAEVMLVTGPSPLVPPAGCEVIQVETAMDMKKAVLQRVPYVDAVFMAAAVADYRPEQTAQQKVKKAEDVWQVRLVRNPDIASKIGAAKKASQVLVAFAAETENLRANALKKLKSKNADLMVANDVSRKDAGFDTDTNQATLFFADGRTEELALMPKKDMASILIQRVQELLDLKTSSR